MRRWNRAAAATGMALMAFATGAAVSPSGALAATMRQAVADAPPDSAAFEHDPALFTILAMEPGPSQVEALDAYNARAMFEIGDTLAAIAEDPAVHPLLRANAALLIGRRHDLGHFLILRPLLDAEDVRIRLAVVAAAGEYMPVLEDQTLSVLRTALNDAEPAVQVRAMEAISDRDPDALRAYVRRGPPEQLASVAEGLIRVAEQRGAPLVPDATGAMHKTGSAGDRLAYPPVSRWPGQDLSAGRLELETAAGTHVVLGDSVEVVRNVVPAFFSNDGAQIVFENARMIRVHDIATATTRVVGPGIAPRPLPFTDRFTYAVTTDHAPVKTGGQAQLEYVLYSLPFAAKALAVPADSIGTISTISSFGVSGGASPVRWMRIIEDAGIFSLRSDSMDPVPLPDPFREAGG